MALIVNRNLTGTVPQLRADNNDPSSNHYISVHPTTTTTSSIQGRVKKEDKSGRWGWISSLIEWFLGFFSSEPTPAPKSQPCRANRGGSTNVASVRRHPPLNRTAAAGSSAQDPSQTTTYIPIEIVRDYGVIQKDRELTAIIQEELRKQIYTNACMEGPLYFRLSDCLIDSGLTVRQINVLLEEVLSDCSPIDPSFRESLFHRFQFERARRMYLRIRLESPFTMNHKEAGAGGDCMFWAVAHSIVQERRSDVYIQQLRKNTYTTFLKKINTNAAFRSRFVETITNYERSRDLGPHMLTCTLTDEQKQNFIENRVDTYPTHLQAYIITYTNKLNTMHVWCGDIEADLLSASLGRSIVILNSNYEVEHVAGHEYFPSTEKEWREHPPITIYSKDVHFQCVTFTKTLA